MTAADNKRHHARDLPSRKDHRSLARAARLGLLLLVLAASLAAAATTASAAPLVALKAKALPIPGFPGTGNILGAGLEVETLVTIRGSEYGGFPSPMTGLNVYTPTGVKLNPAGFTTCAPAALEADGGAGCPWGSAAGPAGTGLGVVAFGGELVPEKVSIQSFFAPGGGLSFYVEGKTPTSFQILEPSHWVPATPPFAQKLIVEVPLIETVPGADDASVLSFDVTVGAAYRRHGRAHYYITGAPRCPRGGFPVEMELHFLSGATVPATTTTPCPAKHR